MRASRSTGPSNTAWSERTGRGSSNSMGRAALQRRVCASLGLHLRAGSGVVAGEGSLSFLPRFRRRSGGDSLLRWTRRYDGMIRRGCVEAGCEKEGEECTGQGFRTNLGQRHEDLDAVLDEGVHVEVREHVEHAHEAVGRLAPEAPVLLLDVVDPHALRAQVLEDGVPLAEVERVLADEDQPRPRLEVEEARVPDAEAVVRDAVDVHAGDARRQALHEPPLGSWSLRGVRQHRRPGLAIQLGAPGIAAVHVRRDLLLLGEEVRLPCLDVIQAQAVGKIVWLVLVQERRDLHGIFAHFWCWPVFEK
jgi:hypothetical protein